MTKSITDIAYSIQGYIEESCRNIFRTYLEELAKEPVSYIIYSVWGVSAEGELTNIQKDIHARLQPTVEKIFKSLALEDLNLDRRMGIEYLIRGFIISRMFFMVELLKATVSKNDTSNQDNRNILNNVEVMGHA